MAITSVEQGMFRRAEAKFKSYTDAGQVPTVQQISRELGITSAEMLRRIHADLQVIAVRGSAK